MNNLFFRILQKKQPLFKFCNSINHFNCTLDQFNVSFLNKEVLNYKKKTDPRLLNGSVYGTY